MTFPLMPMIIPNTRPGENWENIGNISYGYLRSIAVGATGSVMIGAQNLDVLFSSNYGSAISTKSVTVGVNTIYGVAYGSGLFAVSNQSTSNVYTSADNGDIWTLKISGSYDNNSVTFNDGYFVLGSGDEGGDGFAFYSTDGTTWRRTPITGPNSCQCGIYVTSLSRTFVGGSSEQCKYRNSVPPYETNGDTWTGNSTGITGLIYNVAWSESLSTAVCVGTTGIFSSYDMRAWTRVSTAPNMRAVAWCGDIFTAVGADGKIYTSSDGLSWTNQVSNTTEHLYGVAYTGGVILAAGDAGVILRSS